jgi:predicted secreted Zn-dependent protease
VAERNVRNTCPSGEGARIRRAGFTGAGLRPPRKAEQVQRGLLWNGRASARRQPNHGRLGLAMALVLLLPWLARAQNSFVQTTNYYFVTGANFHELRHSMNAARPPRLTPPMAGLTEWELSWQFAVAPSTGGCRCVSFTTRLVITTTLPFWRVPTNASPELVAAWPGYFSALALHEAGHTQVALAALAETHRRIKSLRDDPDCRDLRTKINKLLLGVIDSYREMDRNYDEWTEHGVKQGAVLQYTLPDPGTPDATNLRTNAFPRRRFNRY